MVDNQEPRVAVHNEKENAKRPTHEKKSVEK